MLGVRAGGGADWRRVRQDGNGSLSLEEFTLMIGRSPLRATLSDGKVARMYSELVSQEGIMTKRDWLSLFRYVEVRAAAIRLRGRRAACRLLRSSGYLLNRPRQPHFGLGVEGGEKVVTKR